MAELQKIGSLERGLIILEILQANNEMGVTEIGKKLGVNKSTAYRLLATLESRGFVEQISEAGKYRLGMKMAKFKTRILDDFQLRTMSHPYLKKLSEKTNEAAGFCVMLDNEGLLIDKADSPQNIGATLVVGMNEPLYCTSLGKILLASFTDEERIRLLKSVTMYKRTEKTVTDIDKLLAESEQIVKDGYTLDDEQYCEGMRCIAAPVYDYTGKVIASMGISAPIGHISDEKIPEYVHIVKSVASELSLKLGY